jgi:hypothetical protein
MATVTGTEFESPAPFVAEHVSVTPAVSEVRFVVVQPLEEATPDSGSVAAHATEIALVYQPLLPSVPVMVGVIDGAV